VKILVARDGRPDLALAHFSVGGVYEVLGKMPEAEAMLREAIVRGPRRKSRRHPPIKLPPMHGFEPRGSEKVGVAENSALVSRPARRADRVSLIGPFEAMPRRTRVCWLRCDTAR
jgi:hypothetical protein